MCERNRKTNKQTKKTGEPGSEASRYCLKTRHLAAMGRGPSKFDRPTRNTSFPSAIASPRRPGSSALVTVSGDTRPSLPRTVNADRRAVIASRPGDNPLFSYVAPGGGKVVVPRIVRPHDELKLERSAVQSEIKAAFKRDTNHNQRQLRVMASLSYHMLTSTSTVQRYRRKSNSRDYEIEHPDAVVYAVTGDTTKLLAEISRNNHLLRATGEHNHTLLYLTARSGFYDTCEALLKVGAPVNCQQVDGSTPLHGASFYGHRIIVELLLEYGADPTVKNKWGNTPVDEAGSDDVCELFSRYKDDAISKVVTSLMAQNLASRVRLIEYQGKVIGKEILRSIETLDSSTKCMWTTILSNWETAWHGTKSCNLQSIICNGLMPSGTKLPDGEFIKPPTTHYQLGDKHFGIDNWAQAIFLSPSILYASHACYAERVFSEGTRWCVLVKGHVKPSSYTSYDPTVYNYDPTDGEPDCPEYRIPVSSEKERIIRVESNRSVVVISIVFIRLEFLENLASNDLTFDELQTMFA